MAKEAQQAYRTTYVTYNTIATCICILSPVPLLIGAFTEKEFLTVGMLCVTILLAGIGVMLFIMAGVRWASMQKLLKEGEYSEAGKKKSKLTEAVGTAYWLAATAVYLGWSFWTNDWYMTWMVWPIAGVLFAGVMAICNLFADRSSEK